MDKRSEPKITKADDKYSLGHKNTYYGLKNSYNIVKHTKNQIEKLTINNGSKLDLISTFEIHNKITHSIFKLYR